MPFGINTDKLRYHGASHASTPPPSDAQPDIDLVTLLTHSQREELLRLISHAVESMRISLIHAFDPAPKKPKNDAAANAAEDSQAPPERTHSNPFPQMLTRDSLKMSRVKESAITSFDKWEKSLLSRIFDILNPSDVEKRGGTAAHMQHTLDAPSRPVGPPTSTDDNIENSNYPSILTELATSLPEPVKPLIIQSLLLIVLSLETYDARSRTLLRILSASLNLPPQSLVTIEKSVAATLINTAKAHMSGEEETKAKKSQSTWNRRIKIGIAGVAGAAVIGITGGLAAPFIAAGLGTVMTGIGLGATAAAGYLGALAGSGALIGALFGAYGGKMTGEMMKRYAQEIEDFAFLPVKQPGSTTAPASASPPRSPYAPPTSSSPSHSPYAPPSSSPTPRSPYAPPDTASSSSCTPYIPPSTHQPSGSPPPPPRSPYAPREPSPPPPALPPRPSEPNSTTTTDSTSTNRLTVTIGISGWITTPEDFETPWRTLNSDSTDIYALRWETTALMDLGSALNTMLKTYAFAYLKIEIIKRTVLASLMAAMWPIALLKVGKVVDNPFNIAKLRAEKAGRILADVLINRAQGGRPVTLVAYSLGARVVYSALVELAERRAFGLVENVYVLGAPVPSGGDDGGDWVAVRGVVSGRVVNVYSENDYVLGFLYRTSAVQLGVAGLQSVRWPDGVENVNVSQDVEGHLRYRFLVGDIVGKVAGGEMVDWVVVEEERRKAEELKKLEEKMEKEAREKESEGGATGEELEEAAKKVEEQEAQRRVAKGVAEMRMA
ncbi:hypothetical protein Dda_4371 [Drechslerella dactyloides]|uniref:DUF726-domain-containing protein n=1 Tax=Drechslerella dactyloides TaxID=74499 RepID=A0AAD6IWR9_DREDA|nr:hypothetical protein Dda_4371 [Drechslerella dactyloides]